MIKTSDFYWGFCMMFTIQFCILYKITNDLYFIMLAFFIFCVGLLISHNKKIRNSFDKEDKVKALRIKK
jgi:hypothetical protein